MQTESEGGGGDWSVQGRRNAELWLEGLVGRLEAWSPLHSLNALECRTHHSALAFKCV
ncbi:unnamed protein product [Ixodes persulcatus]